jgi:hypothetical protein
MTTTKPARKKSRKPSLNDARGERPSDPNQFAKWIADASTEQRSPREQVMHCGYRIAAGQKAL